MALGRAFGLLIGFTFLAAAPCHADGTARNAGYLGSISPPLWTGLYGGVQAGYAWGDNHTAEFITATGVATGFDQGFEPDGAVGGIHIGYNHQIDSIVIGIEADIEASSIDGGYRLANNNGTDFELNWLGSVRGRLGYAAGRTLVYATGGVAFGDIEHTYVQFTPRLESFSDTETGWTAGGGIEHWFAPNLSARVEYRHYEFDDISNNSTFAFPGHTYKHDPQFETVRAGLSYHFDREPSVGPLK